MIEQNQQRSLQNQNQQIDIPHQIQQKGKIHKCQQDNNNQQQICSSCSINKSTIKKLNEELIQKDMLIFKLLNNQEAKTIKTNQKKNDHKRQKYELKLLGQNNIDEKLKQMVSNNKKIQQKLLKLKNKQNRKTKIIKQLINFKISKIKNNKNNVEDSKQKNIQQSKQLSITQTTKNMIQLSASKQQIQNNQSQFQNFNNEKYKHNHFLPENNEPKHTILSQQQLPIQSFKNIKQKQQNKNDSNIKDKKNEIQQLILHYFGHNYRQSQFKNEIQQITCQNSEIIIGILKKCLKTKQKINNIVATHIKNIQNTLPPHLSSQSDIEPQNYTNKQTPPLYKQPVNIKNNQNQFDLIDQSDLIQKHKQKHKSVLLNEINDIQNDTPNKFSSTVGNSNIISKAMQLESQSEDDEIVKSVTSRQTKKSPTNIDQQKQKRLLKRLNKRK